MTDESDDLESGSGTPAPAAIAATENPVQLTVGLVEDDRIPEGMICMGSYRNGRLIARSVMPPEAWDQITQYGIFDEPVQVVLVARAAAGVGRRTLAWPLDHRHQAPAAKSLDGGELQLQHAGHAQRAGEIESAVGQEIPQRIGDRPPAVELDPTQDVRAVPDHRVGTGVHHGVSPGSQLAPRLLAQRLRHPGDMKGTGPLGAPVEGDHQKVHHTAHRIHHRDAPRDVEQVVGERIGGESHQADSGDAVAAAHGVDRDLAQRAVGPEPERAQHGGGGIARVGTEVAGVVVGQVEMGDARVTQPGREPGRGEKGVTHLRRLGTSAPLGSGRTPCRGGPRCCTCRWYRCRRGRPRSCRPRDPREAPAWPGRAVRGRCPGAHRPAA